ncbi:hypothetical protein AB0E12_13650 [Micromonospora chersina]|uniref:hypothetical protein n=1 Tax=Micromonospora chersina TaxID=47854 RepID=UPI0033E7B976
MESATGQRASVRGWLQDLWLVAIYDDVPEDEVRRWWNSKETDVLDVLVDLAPGIRLGPIVTADGDPPSPTQRVSSLMFLRGTCPEDFEPDAQASYVMPLLDAGLRAALVAAFAPRPGDRPLLAAEPVDALAAFLDDTTERGCSRTHPPRRSRCCSVPTSGDRAGPRQQSGTAQPEPFPDFDLFPPSRSATSTGQKPSLSRTGSHVRKVGASTPPAAGCPVSVLVWRIGIRTCGYSAECWWS